MRLSKLYARMPAPADPAPAYPPTPPAAPAPQSQPATTASADTTSLLRAPADPPPKAAGGDPVVQAAQPAAPKTGNDSGTTAPEQAQDISYDAAPTGIYAVCRQLGIMVPDDVNVIVEQTKTCLVTIFKKLANSPSQMDLIWPMVKSISSDIEEFIKSNKAVLNVLHRNRTTNGEKLAWHCIYTSILAMGMARSEKNLPCSMMEIGGAALIHDMGFLVLSGKYNDIESELDNDRAGHVAKGVELARMLDIPEIAVKMIAMHHGRLDNKGFPNDLSRSTFERCCQIISLANMAELIIFSLPFARKEDVSSGNSGLTKILHEYRHAYDADLLKKMISLVGFYPVGSVVELNNHVICKVVRQNPIYPLRPVVQVVVDGTGMHPDRERLIDLHEMKILSIIRTLASPEIQNIA